MNAGAGWVTRRTDIRGGSPYLQATVASLPDPSARLSQQPRWHLPFRTDVL